MYREYGGEEFTPEKMRDTLVDLLPTDLATYATMQANSYKTYATMKAFIKDHIQVLTDQANRSHRGPYVVEDDLQPGGSDGASEQDSERSTFDDCPPEVMLMIQSRANDGDAECLAMMQKWRYPRKFNGGAGAGGAGRKYNGGAAAGGGNPRDRRVEPPPRDRRDVKCANCNKNGHVTAECPDPKKAFNLRDCFNCGQPGHLSRDCPKPKKPRPGNVNSVAGATPAAAGGNRPAYMLMFGSEDIEHTRRVKDQRAANVAKHGPQAATFGDFLDTNIFDQSVVTQRRGRSPTRRAVGDVSGGDILTANSAVGKRSDILESKDTAVSKEEWPLLADDARRGETPT